MELVGDVLLNWRSNCFIIWLKDFDQSVSIRILRTQNIKFQGHWSILKVSPHKCSAKVWLVASKICFEAEYVTWAAVYL